MPFSGPVDHPLREQGFHALHPPIHAAGPAAKLLETMRRGHALDCGLTRWNDRYFDPCAKLIYLAYANHIDGEINDQYRSKAGALRFLKNIILLPGCGQFVPGASFVLHQPGSDELARRGADQRSFARRRPHHANLRPARLSRPRPGPHADEHLIDALRGLKFQELTLTVTSENHGAVQLYEKLGFRTIEVVYRGRLAECKVADSQAYGCSLLLARVFQQILQLSDMNSWTSLKSI